MVAAGGAAAGESGEESPPAGAGVSERLAAEWADADEPPLLTDGGMGA